MRLPLPPPPRRLSRILAGERACRFCERYRPSRRFFFLRVCFFLPTQLPPWTACAWTPPQVPLLRAAPISRKRASERRPTGLFTLVYAWCPHEGDEECSTTLTCVRRGARVISTLLGFDLKRGSTTGTQSSSSNGFSITLTLAQGWLDRSAVRRNCTSLANLRRTFCNLLFRGAEGRGAGRIGRRSSEVLWQNA